MTLHWSAQLVGIPYVAGARSPYGADCYGLAFLALEQRGIRLELHAGVDPDHTKAETIAALIDAETCSEEWVRPETPREFDLLLFHMGGMDRHIGIVVAPGLMLHADRGAGQSCIERYDEGRWARRLAGIYRHRDLRGRP